MSAVGSETKEFIEKTEGLKALTVEQQKELLEAIKLSEKEGEKKVLSLINDYKKLLSDEVNQAFVISLIAASINSNAKSTLTILLNIIPLKDLEKAFPQHNKKQSLMCYALDASVSSTIISILVDHGISRAGVKEAVQYRLYQASNDVSPILEGLNDISSYAPVASATADGTWALEGMTLAETSSGYDNTLSQQTSQSGIDALAQTSATWSLSDFSSTEAIGFRALNNNEDITSHSAEEPSYAPSLLPMFASSISLISLQPDLNAKSSITTFDSPLF